MSRYFKPRTEAIEVEGVVFLVHELTAGEMIDMDRAEPTDRAFCLLANTVQGPDGDRIGTIEEARALPSRVFRDLLEAALRINGLSASVEEDEAEASSLGNDQPAKLAS